MTRNFFVELKMRAVVRRFYERFRELPVVAVVDVLSGLNHQDDETLVHNVLDFLQVDEKAEMEKVVRLFSYSLKVAKEEKDPVSSFRQALRRTKVVCESVHVGSLLVELIDEDFEEHFSEEREKEFQASRVQANFFRKETGLMRTSPTFQWKLGNLHKRMIETDEQKRKLIQLFASSPEKLSRQQKFDIQIFINKMNDSVVYDYPRDWIVLYCGVLVEDTYTVGSDVRVPMSKWTFDPFVAGRTSRNGKVFQVAFPPGRLSFLSIQEFTPSPIDGHVLLGLLDAQVKASHLVELSDLGQIEIYTLDV